MCLVCQSLEWIAEPAQTLGTVHSYVIHYHPPLPDYPTPHAVVLVDIDDGIRITGALTGCRPEDVVIGMPVKLEFADRGNGFWLYFFSPVET